ncbi:uncharacterized protein LOC134251713 [Saccostrea cucullata]|uniref:uncharacterized protein LOC134251699 n=1 Tax=Saccostrea cuccullata TaxID=36930 RepID=UPI002ED04893
MNKSVILMILPCVIALAVVAVEGMYYYPAAQTSVVGGVGNTAARQAYQQRYLQEWFQTRQQRNQLNKLAKQSTFSTFVNYIPLVLLLTTLTNNTALPIIG